MQCIYCGDVDAHFDDENGVFICNNCQRRLPSGSSVKYGTNYKDSHIRRYNPVDNKRRDAGEIQSADGTRPWIEWYWPISPGRTITLSGPARYPLHLLAKIYMVLFVTLIPLISILDLSAYFIDSPFLHRIHSYEAYYLFFFILTYVFFPFFRYELEVTTPSQSRETQASQGQFCQDAHNDCGQTAAFHNTADESPAAHFCRFFGKCEHDRRGDNTIYAYISIMFLAFLVLPPSHPLKEDLFRYFLGDGTNYAKIILSLVFFAMVVIVARYMFTRKQK